MPATLRRSVGRKRKEAPSWRTSNRRTDSLARLSGRFSAQNEAVCGLDFRGTAIWGSAGCEEHLLPGAVEPVTSGHARGAMIGVVAGLLRNGAQ